MDFLLHREVGCVCVLDISRAALDRSQSRLAHVTHHVQWIEGDVTGDWPVPTVDIWHDRAVFHFLTDRTDQERYVARLRQAVKPRGSAIIATFAPDGPKKCSGLPVVRYSPEVLEKTLGAGFRLQEAVRESHATPFATTQEFWYSRFLRRE